MPTTRLMQFSPTGGSEETIEDDGKRSSRLLPGVSSSHFLRLIEERGHTGFWTLEFATNHVTISVGLYRLFGVDPTIPLGREDLIKIMHPDDRASNQDLHESLRSGHSIDREFRIVRPDGTMRWLKMKADVIVDAGGRPTRAVGVLIDVTDQHAARQSVEDGWNRYRTLAKSVGVMELRMDADGEIADWGGWYELTGQSQEQARRWGWLDTIHPDDREQTRTSCLSNLATGGIGTVEHRIRCADGQYRWFLARTAPIIDRNEKIQEWVGVLIEMETYKHSTDDGCDQVATTLEAPHIRAARALLGWTIDDLALKAGVSVSSVRRLEADAGHTVRNHLLQSVRNVFRDNGVSFTSGPKTRDVSIRLTQI